MPDELLQTGRIALWESALKHYRLPSDQFEATALLRIRGALQDEAGSRKVLSWRRSKQRDRLSIVYIDDGEIESRANKLLAELATNWEPEQQLDRERMLAALKPLVQRLPKRERGIMRALLSGRDQRSVALDEGITQPRISQITAEITDLLRRKLWKKLARRRRATGAASRA